MSAGRGDLVFVGDVHLQADDARLGPFCGFLERLATSASRLVLLGDLFELWIGQRVLEQPHQTAVLERLAALRAQGLVVRYVEGNRDFRIGPGHAGQALDEATTGGISERFGGRRLWAIHGDLANPADRQYRAWRWLSRSAPVWALYNLLPRRQRLNLAAALEQRMRTTNREFRREFPEAAVRAYAARFLRAGHDAVVLGHFHVERELSAGTPERAGGRVFVLPAWGESRRHLRVSPQGEIDFVDS